jgi:hypothetical protein
VENPGTPADTPARRRKDLIVTTSKRGRHAPGVLAPNLLALAGLGLLLGAAGGAGLVPILVAVAGLGLLLAASALHARAERREQRRRDVDSTECALCPHVRVAHRRDTAACAICDCPRFLVSVDQVADLVAAGLIDCAILDAEAAEPSGLTVEDAVAESARRGRRRSTADLEVRDRLGRRP